MSRSANDDGPISKSAETIHVAVRSLEESKYFTVRKGCTVRQLKRDVAGRMGVQAESLVLIHSSRVLNDSDRLSHLKTRDGSVRLCMVQRLQPPSAAPTSDAAAPELVQSDLTAGLHPHPDNFTPPPASPLCLVEALDGLGLSNSGPGVFPALQLQMENQLLAHPDMMRRVLGSPFVQNTLSNASPQMTRQLILSNPQIQQLMQTNPEVEDMLNNADVITQVLELVRNPDLTEEVMRSGDEALRNMQPEQDTPESIAGGDSDGLQRNDTKRLRLSRNQNLASPVVTASDGSQQQTERGKEHTPALSSHSTDPIRELSAMPTAGMQSLMEEITSSPGLMESLMSGPYVNSLLNCLRQNPDMAAQMLLSHPLFSGNPQLQQQMRQQIPLLLQQMQSTELLSVMLNPRAMEALLQIQQALQTLAEEAPALVPMAGLGNTGASSVVDDAPEPSSDSVHDSQSEGGPPVATVTEVEQQQQQFVEQMLQALANSNYQVRGEEFHEELEQLSSMGFTDRQANLQALISTGGDLTTTIQHLLSL